MSIYLNSKKIPKKIFAQIKQIEKEFNNLKQFIAIIYGSYNKQYCSFYLQQADELLPTQQDHVNDYPNTLNEAAEKSTAINDWETQLENSALAERLITIKKINNNLVAAGLVNISNGNRINFLRKNIKNLYLKIKHGEIGQLPSREKLTIQLADVPLLQEIKLFTQELVNKLANLLNNLNKLLPVPSNKSLATQAFENSYKLEDFIMELEQRTLIGERWYNAIELAVAHRDLKAYPLEKMINALKETLKQLSDKYEKSNNKIVGLSSLKNNLQKQREDYVYLKDVRANTVEFNNTLEDESFENLISRSLEIIAIHLDTCRLFFLAHSPRRPLVNFICNLLKPLLSFINLLFKSLNKQPFRVEFFAGNTERAIAQAAEELLSSLDDNLQKKLVHLLRQKIQNRSEQFKNSSQKDNKAQPFPRELQNLNFSEKNINAFFNSSIQQLKKSDKRLINNLEDENCLHSFHQSAFP